MRRGGLLHKGSLNRGGKIMHSATSVMHGKAVHKAVSPSMEAKILGDVRVPRDNPVLEWCPIAEEARATKGL